MCLWVAKIWQSQLNVPYILVCMHMWHVWHLLALETSCWWPTGGLTVFLMISMCWCVSLSSIVINKMEQVTLSCDQYITLFVLTHWHICVCACVCVSSYGLTKIYSSACQCKYQWAYIYANTPTHILKTHTFILLHITFCAPLVLCHTLRHMLQPISFTCL